MYEAIILPRISGVLGKFPNIMLLIPPPNLHSLMQPKPLCLCRGLLWDLLQSSAFGVLVSRQPESGL